MYFYKLLKPLSDLTTLKDEDYLDWGHEEKFAIQRAVGECAGVIIDLVATLIYETEEKYAWALEAYQNEQYSDAIYHAYNVFINGAKALLLAEGVKTNSQNSVMKKFDEYFVENKVFEFEESFRTHVLQIKENEPTKEFAQKYIQWAENFLNEVKGTRSKQVSVA